jgi:hypothetical protein
VGSTRAASSALEATRALREGAVLEVSDGHPPGGNLVERPSSRGGMECSPARRATKPLRSSTTLPWLELAFAPIADRHAGHREDR